jgi:hypothetical protein
MKLSDNLSILFYIILVTVVPLSLKLINVEKISFLSKIGYLSVFLIIFVVIGLRYNVGSDYYSYISIYNDIANLGILSSRLTFRTEPLYALLNYIIYILFDNHLFVFLSTGLIIVSLYFISVQRYLKKTHYPVALFVFLTGFYFGFFTYIRLSIAAMIIMYGYKFLLDKKVFKWIMIVLIATGFHYTAIVMLPIYFFVKKRFNKTIFNYIFISGIFMIILLFPTLINLLLYNTKYFSYFEGESFGNITGGINQIILHLPVFLFIMYSSKRILRYHENLSEIYKVFVYGSFIMPLVLYLGILDRMLIYFFLSQVILVPIALSSSPKRERLLIIFSIVLYYVSKFVYSLFSGSRLIPYNWIF